MNNNPITLAVEREFPCAEIDQWVNDAHHICSGGKHAYDCPAYHREEATRACQAVAPRWIPVTESEPPDGELVWTRTIALGYERERKYQALRMFSKRWFAQYDSLFLNTVDAWMPILADDPPAPGNEQA